MAVTIYNDELRHVGWLFWHIEQLKNIPGTYNAGPGGIINIDKIIGKTYSDHAVPS